MKTNQYHFSLLFYNGEKLTFHCYKESITSAFIHLGKSLNLNGCKELHLKVVEEPPQPLESEAIVGAYTHLNLESTQIH